MRRCFGIAGLALAGSLLAPGLHAQENTLDLPRTLAWSAYDVGSGGYNQAIAIGNALKQKYGVNLRVIPGKNDASRSLPLRQGQVQFAATGIAGTYMAQEGMDEFGKAMWGPQPVRAVLLNNSDQILTVIAAADAGIKTPADLKGKRVSWVIAAPSVNAAVTGILAFGGLTWDDVQKVDFGGFGASMDGVVGNRVDAAFTSSISGKAYEVAKSPRGMVYLEMPKDDVEGWKRLQAAAPYMIPAMGTEGADLSPEKPAESASYPYPVLMTNASTDASLVNKMLKAMDETFDEFKDAAPGNVGWALDRQTLSWVVPYHDGAIEFFKSKGMWTDADQKNNDMLVKRQEVLAKAWQDVKSRKHANEAEFEQDWMKTRADALAAAGMDVGTSNW